MASVRPMKTKKGVTYEIVVYDGQDLDGKPKVRRDYYRPEPGMTPAKAEKAAQRFADDFEQKIKRGDKADTRITFAEYAERFMERKEKTLKHNTMRNYRHVLKRTNEAIGHKKLRDLRPEHIETFMNNLRERGVREGEDRAVATKLMPMLQERKMSQYRLADKAGVHTSTIRAAVRGQRVALQSAEKMAAALDMPVEGLFMVTRKTEPLSEKMVLEYYAFIHLLLKDAYKNGYVEFNAAERVDRPRPEQKEIESLQPDEVQTIFDALDSKAVSLKWKVITHLMLVTGCRRGEIAGLRWCKVDLEQAKLTIDKTLLYSKDKGLYEDSTKTKQTRIVTIPAETVVLLREYRTWYDAEKSSYGEYWQRAQVEKDREKERRWRGSDFLFVQAGGWPVHPGSINSWLREFAKKHHLPPINPHKFRHTQASVLIYNGADIVSVAKRLGHAQVSTTSNIYAHAIADADARNSDCIANVFFSHRDQKSG